VNGKSLYLVDGSAIFYRAYFAFIRNPLFNSKGENTSASYGFINSLMKIIREENPDYMAVVFDTKAPTFRHKMYDQYKATREKMPDELVVQIPRIHQAADALNLTCLEMEGYEADDIIGTLAVEGEKQGMNVWLVTGDKDFFQLVNDKVKIYNPQRGGKEAEKLDSKGVKEKFGVSPENVIDMLALMGDSSDNVPGVPGIGPKTAKTLIEQFGSLDAIIKSVDKIKSKSVKTKISENLDKAELSRKLVTIEKQVPIEFSLEKMKRGDVDFDKAKKLFLELEFAKLLEDLAKQTGKLDLQLDHTDQVRRPHEAELQYECIDSLDRLKEILSELSKEKEVAVDTETTSLDSMKAELVGISLCAHAGKAYYIPIKHSESDRNIDLDKSLSLLNKFFLNNKVQKFGQNIKYDLAVLRRAGIEINPVGFDTMLASYVVNPSGRGHGLNNLAFEHFNYRMQPISELIGTGKKQISFALVDVDKAVFYAAEDADYTYRLRGVLAKKLEDYNLHNLYYNIELPLINVLLDMEMAGVRVDTEYLSGMSKEMDVQLDKLTRDIYTEAGEEFNINSPRQLAVILFEKLKLPTKGKTAKKTGYSTDVKVLEGLTEFHDLPQLVLDYRQLTKLKNTYIDAIPTLVNEETGRVHTSFNQTVAATGRLSSTDPNLQNIPIRTEIGRQIRKAFIPKNSNYRILKADYSQIELRILAHFSEDKGLIKAFRNNEDIHSRTAADVYGVDLKDITQDMRRAAKTANFAVIYGVTAYGLSQQTELDLGQSKDFIDTYFERYPGIRKYMDETIELAKKDGFVKTLFNRIRYLPEINAKNFQVRQFAERTAINTPIQGTAADMIKVAMIDIHKKMSGMKSKMILQVHDELVFDVHKDEMGQLKEIVKVGMEKAVKLKVPILVDMGVGKNWLETK